MSPTRLRTCFTLALTFALHSLPVAAQFSSQPCVPVPAGTTFWAPLDESAGAPLHNIAKPTGAGQDVGNPAIYSGFVSPGWARHYNGSNQYTEFPHHPWLNPWYGTTPGDHFTIDCWVNVLAGGDVSGLRTLVDKREWVNGSPRGFVLFLDGGYLGFQMADGQWSNYVAYIPSHRFLPDNQWHHVAVSIDRPSGLGTLYMDMVPWNFDPSNRPGSLYNTGPMRIGATTDLVPTSHFSGIIDEVALSQHSLTATQLNAVYTAAPFGTSGKCKSDVAILAPPGFTSANQLCAWIPVRIWNNNVFPVTYSFSMQSLPANTVAGCGLNGPTQLVVTASSITVSPFASGDIWVLANRPLGGPGYACVRCQVGDGNHVMKYDAGFWVDNSALTTGPTCTWNPNTLVRAGVNQEGLTSFTLGNTGASALTVDYRFVVRGPDGAFDQDTVSLDGLPPGSPLAGTLTLAPGQSLELPVSATFVRSDPMRDYSIVLFSDSGVVPIEIGFHALRDSHPIGLFTEVTTPTPGVVEMRTRGSTSPVGATILSFLTFARGSYPHGWLGGLDIALNDLLDQFALGAAGFAPFALPAEADWSLAGLPPGIPVWGVSVELGPTGSPHATSNPFHFTTR